jgi:hypothetical protein
MNFGPIEFAAYLERRQPRAGESAAVTAARDGAPMSPLARNRLSVVSGPRELGRTARNPVLTVSVFEAIANPIGSKAAGASQRVTLTASAGPVVLVVSSLRAVRWQIERAAGAVLVAVLVAGRGDSTVAGVEDVPVISIGGFYAFRAGSEEFRHLENEVLRATGCGIHGFESGRVDGDREIAQIRDR